MGAWDDTKWLLSAITGRGMVEQRTHGWRTEVAEAAGGLLEDFSLLKGAAQCS